MFKKSYEPKYLKIITVGLVRVLPDLRRRNKIFIIPNPEYDMWEYER